MHELIIRQVLRGTAAVEQAERAIVTGLADVSVRGMQVVITDTARFATVVGQWLTDGLAFRATVSVACHDWQ